MPEWTTDWLGVVDYEKIKDSFISQIKEVVPESEFEVVFEEGGPEDSTKIHILAKEPWHSKIDKLVNTDSFNDWITCVKADYGRFYVYSGKLVATGLTDIKLGNFVKIDSQFGSNDKVGIVTAVMNVDGKKLFGCSYLCIELLKQFSWKDGLSLTQEDYGGYHEGFEKKLTLAEVQSILKKSLTQQVEKAKQQIDDSKIHTEKQIDEVLTKLVTTERQEIQDIKRLRFKTYTDLVHDSLKTDPDENQDEDID